MTGENELILHRCAIFGVKSVDEYTFNRLKEAILQSISDSYKTFISEASEGYELFAAQFICSLKELNTDLKLVIVQPYYKYNHPWKSLALFEETCAKSDLVKFVSISSDPDAWKKTHQWIITHSNRIICATNTSNSKINRLNAINLQGKEIINVFPKTDSMANNSALENTNSGEEYSFKSETLQKPKYPDFPYNFLMDLLGKDNTKYEDIISEFPGDIEDRIMTLLSKDDLRTQDIIRQRYLEKKTLHDIGEQYDISRERARQIIKREFRRFKHKSRMNFLHGINPPAPQPAKTDNTVGEDTKSEICELQNITSSETALNPEKTNGSIGKSKKLNV